MKHKRKRKRKIQKIVVIVAIVVIVLAAIVFMAFFQMGEETSTPQEENVKQEIELQEESVVNKEEEVEEEIIELAEEISLDVPMVYQRPELPTGCEITSLAMVLNYYGYDIDKCSLSDEYLDKGPTFETNPYHAFMGEPRSVHSYGCYAPVIVNAAKKYLSTVGNELLVYDMSGSDFEDFLPYLNKGIPVIVWETIGMKESYCSSSFTVNGETVEGITNEHCMVLIGYDQDHYIMADPLAGIKYYGKDIVVQRYNEMNRQAVIVM
ncbi:MAG: C39 family peptidase [Lachnospiraceae bacterium]|nr:C39 family peptidase [Lachnospiraceae bacterium]